MRVAARFTPADAAVTARPYTLMMSVDKPMPSAPIFPVTNAPNATPVPRSSSDVAVIMIPFTKKRLRICISLTACNHFSLIHHIPPFPSL